jgi:two-component system chemotaxis response regulator CheB
MKSDAKKAQNIVVIAASIGGIEALQTLVEMLPTNLEAAVAIVQHISRHHPSQLAQILSRHTPMPVKQVSNGDFLCQGCIFVAPPNCHILIQRNHILTLSTASPVHFCRPSAEPLFSSAAAVFGKHVVGVVLTGADSDGFFGVKVIKNAGGCVIVQDETTSANFEMPRSAILTGQVDHILPLNEIASSIVKLVNKMETSEKNKTDLAFC